MIFELQLLKTRPAAISETARRPDLSAKADLLGVWSAVSGRDLPCLAVLKAYAGHDALEEDGQLDRALPGMPGDEIAMASRSFLLTAAPGFEPDPAALGSDGIFELRLQAIAFGEAARAHAFLRDHEVAWLRQRGASIAGIFDVWFGQDMPMIVSLLAWPDLEAVRQARAAHDGQFARQLLDLRSAIGEPVFGAAERHLLEPAPSAHGRQNEAGRGHVDP
jgi:hypothetical protein